MKPDQPANIVDDQGGEPGDRREEFTNTYFTLLAASGAPIAIPTY